MAEVKVVAMAEGKAVAERVGVMGAVGMAGDLVAAKGVNLASVPAVGGYQPFEIVQ